MSLPAEFDMFFDCVRSRLERGATDYANRNLDARPDDLIGEIQQELEDVCGWSALLWRKLERIRLRVHEAIVAVPAPSKDQDAP